LVGFVEVDELTGNANDMILKKTSFSASWARACTPDEGILEHHTHLFLAPSSMSWKVAHSIPLTPMVTSIVLFLSMRSDTESQIYDSRDTDTAKIHYFLLALTGRSL
jgi:hypothetical protein